MWGEKQINKKTKSKRDLALPLKGVFQHSLSVSVRNYRNHSQTQKKTKKKLPAETSKINCH